VTSCPFAEILKQLLADRLPPPDVQVIAAHIHGCSTCEEALAWKVSWTRPYAHPWRMSWATATCACKTRIKPAVSSRRPATRPATMLPAKVDRSGVEALADQRKKIRKRRPTGAGRREAQAVWARKPTRNPAPESGRPKGLSVWKSETERWRRWGGEALEC
jgi:hypothetical protein